MMARDRWVYPLLLAAIAGALALAAALATAEPADAKGGGYSGTCFWASNYAEPEKGYFYASTEATCSSYNKVRTTIRGSLVCCRMYTQSKWSTSVLYGANELKVKTSTNGYASLSLYTDKYWNMGSYHRVQQGAYPYKYYHINGTLYN